MLVSIESIQEFRQQASTQLSWVLRIWLCFRGWKGKLRLDVTHVAPCGPLAASYACPDLFKRKSLAPQGRHLIDRFLCDAAALPPATAATARFLRLALRAHDLADSDRTRSGSPTVFQRLCRGKEMPALPGAVPDACRLLAIGFQSWLRQEATVAGKLPKVTPAEQEPIRAIKSGDEAFSHPVIHGDPVRSDGDCCFHGRE